MATSSGTRPPTSGEASSKLQGEGVPEVPLAEVAAWEPSVVVDMPEASSLEGMAPVEALGASVTDDPATLTSLSTSRPVPGIHTPPPETPLPVLLLVDQARAASGAERQELSRRINRWLDQMVRDGGSRHVADWFHHLIDSGRLEGLEDAAGHSCHETAIRGLLSLGFPYALEVRPEDLERVRPREPRGRKEERDLKAAAVAVLAGGVFTESFLNMGRPGSSPGLPTAEVGAMALALLAVLLSAPRTPLRKLGLAVLLVASVLSISLAFLPGYAGLVSGLAGLVAVLLFALHRS